MDFKEHVTIEGGNAILRGEKEKIHCNRIFSQFSSKKVHPHININLLISIAIQLRAITQKKDSKVYMRQFSSNDN